MSEPDPAAPTAPDPQDTKPQGAKPLDRESLPTEALNTEALNTEALNTEALGTPRPVAGPAAEEARPGAAPVVVKKYANRRLYNTESSSYITLDTLAEMVRQGRDFVVYDARTGEDITRSVLTQIIVEEESKGRAMLPTTFLRQLIGFYGGSLQGLVPRYLEQTMASFARQGEQLREAMQQTMGQLLPPGLEEVRRQNLAMMERAMALFSPFYRPPGQEPAEGGRLAAQAEEIAALRHEVESLRRELATRSEPGSGGKGGG